MMIKINDKMLSIPPFISTSWSRVAAIHMKGGILAITLTDGETIHISGLSQENIHAIFQFHAVYLEKEHIHPSVVHDPSRLKKILGQNEEQAIKLALGSNFDGLGTVMQHNPAQSDSPNLPPEVLEKISAISKIIGPADELGMPKAEKGCNCFYCQIARVVNPSAEAVHEEAEEIKPEDLQFQQWTITPAGSNLYTVTNRLDDHEKYNVFLGEPLGCTCGKTGCEHILAVLKT